MNAQFANSWKTLLILLAVLATHGRAQEAKLASSIRNATTSDLGFRVDADIYVDQSKPPIAQFKTLFTGSKSIEIDVGSGDVMVVDTSMGVIQAFSSSRRVMAEIELEKIESMLNETLAQSATKSSPDSEARSASNLHSTVTNDNGSLVVGDSVIQYRVTPQVPQLPIVAVRYIEFADWTTKLAAVFPPYKPPQLRLRLNEHLMDEKLLPMETKRLTRNSSSNQEVVSKLIVNYSLSVDDKKEILRVANMAQEYKIVAAKEFFARK